MEKSRNKLYFHLELIKINFKNYNYLIKPINKEIKKLADEVFLMYTINALKRLYTNNIIKFDNRQDIIPFTNGKLNLRTCQLEPIVKEDYLTFILDYDYKEERNEDLINKYNLIYVDIINDNAEEVKRFIAYSMTGDIKYTTNFLFNLGRLAANGKSTITNMYRKVLPIYWDQISKDTFNSKIKSNQKDMYKYKTARHIFCDEMNIYNYDIKQFKLICETIMTVKPLYQHTITFDNHSHTYITGNHEARLEADNGLLRKGLLVETTNKFYPEDKFNTLPETEKQNAKIANNNIVDKLDEVDNKIAWIHLHLTYTIEMYRDDKLHVETLQHNFEKYCIDRDNWLQLKIDRLEITNNENDRLTKIQLARLYNKTYI